jgi:hypothetical protein
VNGPGQNRVFGLYRDFPSLRCGVDSLKALHFCDNDISVLLPEAAISETLPVDERPGAASSREPIAFIGGSLGWLTYVRPECPGIIATALLDLGVPRREAELYERNLRCGALLVCIRASSPNRIDSGASALNSTGAERVLRGRTELRTEAGDSSELLEHLAEDRISAVAFIC